MKYYDFFELPISFQVDETALRQKYLENTRLFHPDFYINESEATQAEMMEKSSLNNEAFKVLSNAKARTQYLLTESEILVKGENQLPQDFLFEMMEFNEKIAEIQMSEETDALKSIENEANQILQEMESMLFEYQKKCDSQPYYSQDWQQHAKIVKEYFLKRKYLLRIKDSLSKFAFS
jgi:molecular chaperone HscB